MLIVSTDYDLFLEWLYARRPSLGEASYDEQMQARNDSLFGVAEFYSTNLRNLGHEALHVHFNNEAMQRAWAREHGLRIDQPRAARDQRWGAGTRHLIRRLRRRLGLRPRSRSLGTGDKTNWLEKVLREQIRIYRPDVILNHAMHAVRPSLLREAVDTGQLVVGQHAAAGLPERTDWRCYDLVLSSLPDVVQWFRDKGGAAEFQRLGFEPRILSATNHTQKIAEASFIGSVGPVHGSRRKLLEHVATRLPLRIWAPTVAALSPDSPIRAAYAGPVWGSEMYRALAGSKVTLNQHADFAAHANNMRLYEATGVGTLLVTDWKNNLGEILEPGKEVVAYRSVAECAEMTAYYLSHDREREEIARAGQRRTLRDHTYRQRMDELVQILRKYL